MINLENADYVWVNQDFRLESMSMLKQEFIEELYKRNGKLVYDNQKTKTKVYQIK